MTVIELMMAAFIMLVGVISVVGGLTFGMTLVGGSRQRSSGSTVALERLERIRNLPFDQVALDVMPTHHADPDHPDFKVQSDRYDVASDGPPQLEGLIVGGVVPHVDDPFTLGTTTFSVHQYVTWANGDPGSNLKRIVIVVTWKSPVEAGRPNQVQQSTLVSQVPRADGSTIAGPTPAPSLAPEASPSSTPPPYGCEADTTPPGTDGDGIEAESSVAAVEGFTATTNIQLRLLVTEQPPDGLPCYPLSAELSNDEREDKVFTVVSTELESGVPYTVSWTIEDGADGQQRTIYGRFRDGAGNLSDTYWITMTLDRTPPTAPPNLRLISGSCTFVGNGQNRRVTLEWDTATDQHLFGYRLYRSVDASPFQPVATTDTNTLLADNTSKADAGSVRYMVRAYDKAGTESGDSNVVTFAKNSCEAG